MKTFNHHHHAKLLVYNLATLDEVTVARLAQWLRDQADQLESSPKEYSNNYKARLMK